MPPDQNQQEGRLYGHHKPVQMVGSPDGSGLTFIESVLRNSPPYADDCVRRTLMGLKRAGIDIHRIAEDIPRD